MLLMIMFLIVFHFVQIKRGIYVISSYHLCLQVWKLIKNRAAHTIFFHPDSYKSSLPSVPPGVFVC